MSRSAHQKRKEAEAHNKAYEESKKIKPYVPLKRKRNPKQMAMKLALAGMYGAFGRPIK